MAGWMEMARDLGGAMARTDEYQALHRALKAADDDRELAELRSEMGKLEQAVSQAIESAQQPGEELRAAYEDTFSRLQANSSYQRVVAAQSNFDRILMRVNELITEGMEGAAESRIIVPGS